MTSPLSGCSRAVAASLLLFAALPALPAQARRGESAARHAKKSDANVDPAHWFATREGLLRVYQAHASDKSATDEASGTPAAGASCEVIESSPKDGDTEARTKESCTMISGRMPKGGTLLTYELRATGIFLVETKSEKAAEPVKMEHLLLPSPMHKGTSWNEKHGALTLTRTVKSAGKACTAADRKFGDCLVLAVVEHEGKKTRRKYSEVYAAGVGRVEDAQWELIDVKGL